MKTSWRRLQEFSTAADRYLATSKAETKIRYAIHRVQSQIKACSEKIQTQFSDIEIDNCEVDAAGVIQRDASGNLLYTREGIKLRNQQQRAAIEDEQFEIAPHFVEAPEDLTFAELEAFAGFIIHEEIDQETFSDDSNGSRSSDEVNQLA